jgi:hypothetical protein
MFTPEFRYLLVQEERNGDMMPLIDKQVFADIFVYCANFLGLCSIGLIAYKLFGYSVTASKYVWTALWNSLTPGQQWLEIALIASSIVCATVMFLALKGMMEVLDNGFTKLKNEINKKDERIRELEAKISSLESAPKKVKTQTEEEEAKQLEKWFSRSDKY